MEINYFDVFYTIAFFVVLFFVISLIVRFFKNKKKRNGRSRVA